MKRRTFLKGTAASLAVLATAGATAAMAQDPRVAREQRLLADPSGEIAQLVREGNAMRPWFAPLTTRQAHISELVAVGLTNTEIARHLGISIRTTDAHVMSIFNKLDLHRRKQLAEWVIRSRPSYVSRR
ncbi:MAG: response regulator transcription factor [Chloroflexi bacterium]|nr:MAG: response regulator transcription factor [Chloroflexota bacterium]TMF54363.1 MAG: response regulator transcription factor [Chloroflexota bacterium]